MPRVESLPCEAEHALGGSTHTHATPTTPTDVGMRAHACQHSPRQGTRQRRTQHWQKDMFERQKRRRQLALRSTHSGLWQYFSDISVMSFECSVAEKKHTY